MNQEMMQQLQNPFPFEAIETKIQFTSEKKTTGSEKKMTGFVVFYIDSRMIQNRLDDVLGPLNWKNHYIAWKSNAQLCGIAIYDKERGEWVGKFDGADSTDIEPIKGGLSDSFKRAACIWGIGRYLYQIDGIWVDIERRGNSSVITKGQEGKIKAAYEAGVKRIFDGNDKQPSATQGASNAGNAGNTSNNTKPQAAQAQRNAQKPAPATPRTPATPANQTVPTYDYKVHTVNPSGQGSQLIQLHNASGGAILAYNKPNNQPIVAGAYLRNVDIEEKTNTQGTKYNVINSFELAA